MENKVTVFENEKFGTVRTVVINDEPWFVVADVCNYFGVTNRNRLMKELDEDEKGGYANEYTWWKSNGFYS